jgi:hypothetical protein
VAAVARLPTYAKYGLAVGALVLIGAGAVLVGNTVGDDHRGSERGRVGVTANGRLTGAPARMSPAIIASATKPGTAARAAMKLLYWAQWGSLPTVVHAYDPSVVARVGPSAIADSWGQQQTSLQSMQPRVVDSVAGRRGAVTVTLEMLRQDSPPQQTSMTLRRIGGKPRWYVVFDTMLYNSISNTVAADVIDYLTSENASPNAQRAASAAAASLRQAAVRFGG